MSIARSQLIERALQAEERTARQLKELETKMLARFTALQQGEHKQAAPTCVVCLDAARDCL